MSVPIAHASPLFEAAFFTPAVLFVLVAFARGRRGRRATPGNRQPDHNDEGA